MNIRRLSELIMGNASICSMFCSLQFCYYGDQIPNEPENVLYISNHQCSCKFSPFFFSFFFSFFSIHIH